MKYCSKCGNQINDDAMFCPKCGTPSNTIVEDNSTISKDTGYNAKNEYTVQSVKGSNGKKTIIWVIVAAIVIAIAVIVFMLIKRNKDEDANEEGLIAENTDMEQEVDSDIEEKDEIDIEKFLGSWSYGDRTCYSVTKVDESTVSVEYSGSSSAFDWIEGSGTGSLNGNELKVSMTYTLHKDDEYGSAEYTMDTCEDTVLLCSMVDDNYVLADDETIYYGGNETGEVATVSAVSECDSKENYVIWKNPIDLTEYVFWYSSQKYLSPLDIEALDKDTLRLARNEIYARHGRKFTSDDLNTYFNQKSWYEGTVEADAFNEGVLNEFEKANVKIILECESDTTEYVANNLENTQGIKSVEYTGNMMKLNGVFNGVSQELVLYVDEYTSYCQLGYETIYQDLQEFVNYGYGAPGVTLYVDGATLVEVDSYS